MNSSSEVSAFANIHAQLASIMEILARSAVTEISKLVNDSTEVLLLEMCRRQNENDTLRRKLEWMEMELRAARRDEARESFSCGRTVGVQAGDGLRATERDRLHLERRSAPVGSDFDQHCPRLKANGGAPAAEEEVSRPVSIVESANFERGTPGTPFIKEEIFEEEINSIESRRGLMSFAGGSGSGADARESHPILCRQREEESNTQLLDGSEVQEVLSASTVTAEDLGELEEGKQQRVLRVDQGESQDRTVRSFAPDSVCDTYDKEVHLWTSAIQGDSETETDDPDFPYDTEQSLPDIMEIQPIPATGTGFCTDMLSSRATKPHLGMVSIVPKEEETTVQPGCSEDSKAGLAQSQMEPRERLHSGVVGDLVSRQQDQPSADSFVATNDEADYRFAANSVKMAKKVKGLPRAPKGEKQISCVQCGKSFTTRFYLKIHLRIHTGERPFSCAQCGKSFYCTSHLISHQRSHTGEKPYRCHVCGNSYSHLNSLKLHHKVHRQERLFNST